MSVRETRKRLPPRGEARFRALLTHTGELRHPIGMPMNDDPCSARRVLGLRVGNREHGVGDPETVQVGALIDHIYRSGKDTALVQSEPIGGISFRVSGMRSEAGEWKWVVGAVGPSGEGVQVEVKCDA